MHLRARAAAPLAALAGLTTAAHSQMVGVVTIFSSAATISVGEVVTIGVVLSDNIDGPSVFAFDLHVSGSGAGFTPVADSLSSHPIHFGFEGEISPDGARAFGGSPDLLGPTLDESLDDLTVFSFRIQATQAGLITFDAEDGGFYETVNSLAAAYTAHIFPMDYDELLFENATITVIPAPPGLALLAVMIPLATRRRR